jgi:hypothetical protein
MFLQLKAYDQELNSLKAQVKNYEEKIKELSQDLTNKEELNIALRSELHNTQEKLRIKSDEVKKFTLNLFLSELNFLRFFSVF